MKKYIDKYKNLPVQLRASFWFLICSFLQKGISFITTPIFTRLLSTAEYGQYNVFNSWLSNVTVFVTLNIYGGVYTSGLVKFSEDRSRFISSLEGLLLTLCFFWTITYTITKDFWNSLFGLTTVQMYAMLVLVWTSSVACFWTAEKRVDYKYRVLVAATIAVSIVKPVLGVILVAKAEDKVTARILGLAVVNLFAYTGMFIVQMIRGKAFCSVKYWKHAIIFNIPLIPHYLSQTILNSSDRIMIQNMVGDSEAGIYSLAYSISQIMTLFNTALVNTLEPWIYQRIKDKNIKSVSKVAYSSLILIAAVNILLISLAPEIISIFAPVSYRDAIYTIPPIAMSVYFMFAYNLFAVFQFYYEKTSQIAIATILGAVVNVLLNYVCISKFGYYAAGYTTLVCYMLYALAHYYQMRKTCNTYLSGDMPYSTKILFIITGGFLVLGFAYLVTYSNVFARYLLTAILILILIFFRKKMIMQLHELFSIKKK